METCIEVQNVVKRFRDQVVLKNVLISFEKGKIHGIVGRNGSGKTVLFKCICGLMHPEEGVILVNGKRVGRDVDMPEDIGAIIEAPGFLPNYSGYKNLRFLANIRRKIGKEEILNVLKTVGLTPKAASMWENTRSACGSALVLRRQSWKTQRSSFWTSR